MHSMFFLNYRLLQINALGDDMVSLIILRNKEEIRNQSLSKITVHCC